MLQSEQLQLHKDNFMKILGSCEKLISFNTEKYQ